MNFAKTETTVMSRELATKKAARHVMTFNKADDKALKDLQRKIEVIESARDHIRKGRKYHV